MKNQIIVLNENGDDITSSVIVIKGSQDPLYYRNLADKIFDKAGEFYDQEIIAKRNELSDDEWAQKHTEFKEMMEIGGNYEDKEIAARFKKVINFISSKNNNPLLAKGKLTMAFQKYFHKFPGIAVSL